MGNLTIEVENYEQKEYDKIKVIKELKIKCINTEKIPET